MKSDNVFQTRTVTDDLNVNIKNIPSLKNFPNHVVYFKSNDVYCYRDGNSSKPYYCEELNFHLRDGQLVYGGLLTTYSTSVIVQTRLMDNTIEILLPIVEYNITSVNKTCKLFFVTRDNVNLKGGNIIIPKKENVTQTTWTGELIYVNKCINFTLDGLTASNITAEVASGNSGYVLNTQCIAGYNLLNCKLSGNTWGSLGSGNTKRMTIRDSILNRIDSHALMTDLFVENCHIVGKQGINISCGTGNVHITKCTFDHPEIKHIVNLRSDYGGFLKGNVYVKDCYFTNELTDDCHVMTSSSVNGNCKNRTYGFTMPSLIVENLETNNNGAMFLLNVPNVSNGTVGLPLKLYASHCYNRWENDKRFIGVLKLIRDISLLKATTSDKFDCYLEYINNYTPNKLTVSGFTTSELSSDSNVINNYACLKPLFYMAIENANTTNYIRRISINMKNCVGAVTIHNHDVEFKAMDCNLWALRVSYSNNRIPKILGLYNSRIWTIPYSNLSSTVISGKNLQAVGNVFKALIIDGVKKNTSCDYSDDCLLLIGNVCEQANSNVATILWSKRGSSMIQ